MISWKLVVLVGCALVALGGVAKATGVIGEGPTTGQQETLEAKAERLQAKFEGASFEALSGRGRRGPKGARGPRGFQGPKGATGAPGPTGTFGTVTPVKGPPVFVGPVPSLTAVATAEATCPPGTILVGGGYQGGTIEWSVTWNAPVSASTWATIVVNDSERFSATTYAIAMCASA